MGTTRVMRRVYSEAGKWKICRKDNQHKSITAGVASKLENVSKYTKNQKFVYGKP